jgi:hypothetical protein
MVIIFLKIESFDHKLLKHLSFLLKSGRRKMKRKKRKRKMKRKKRKRKMKRKKRKRRIYHNLIQEFLTP